MNNTPLELPDVYSQESFDSLSTLEMALYLSREHGFSVIPISKSIDTDKISGEKKPNKETTLGSWKQYQDTQPTEEELYQWFSKGDANMAIISGENFDLIELDIDSYKKDYD